ncbi:MAG: tRNA dihydrouridine synthase DusB [Gaiellales bacterium]|nr:tRNA dihydrouridine synthase DusB [Gaiellales bacterium]
MDVPTNGLSGGLALDRSFRIAGLEMPNRVVLGPMAGVTGRAFRRHLKRHGAGLVFTEMVSAYGIVYRNRRTEDYLEFEQEERPLGVQLFAAEPHVLGEAAELVLERERTPDLLDINMGCPVRKVVKTGAGSALLADPARAVSAAAAVVRAAAARVPVTVKLRSGLVPGEHTALELGPRLEAVGVSALCLHPRVASQMYRGTADHAETAALKRLVSIPVIASGDVDSRAAAAAIMERTGADAIMVARGVLGNPWLVSELLQTGTTVLGGAAVLDDLLELLEGVTAEMGQERGVRWFRTHLGWYLKRLRVPARRIGELRAARGVEEVRAGLERLRRELTLTP